MPSTSPHTRHITFSYFGLGTYGDGSDPQRGLGSCFLLDVNGVDRPLLVQSINTGSDVDGNQFDLQVGDGGAGAYNTCAGSNSAMCVRACMQHVRWLELRHVRACMHACVRACVRVCTCVCEHAFALASCFVYAVRTRVGVPRRTY